MGPQRFDIIGGQLNAILPGKIQDGFESYASVEVAVKIDEVSFFIGFCND